MQYQLWIFYQYLAGIKTIKALKHQLYAMIINCSRCHEKDIAIEFMQNYTNYFEPCLEANELTIQHKYLKLLTNLVNKACENGGIDITSAFVDDAYACFGKNSISLEKCWNPMKNKHEMHVNPFSLFINREYCR